MEYLQRFQFKWLYRPGKYNMADPLSNNPPQTPLENEEGHHQVNTLPLLLGVLTRSKGLQRLQGLQGWPTARFY